MDARLYDAMRAAAAGHRMAFGEWVRDGLAAELGEHQVRQPRPTHPAEAAAEGAGGGVIIKVTRGVNAQAGLADDYGPGKANEHSRPRQVAGSVPGRDWRDRGRSMQTALRETGVVDDRCSGRRTYGGFFDYACVVHQRTPAG